MAVITKWPYYRGGCKAGFVSIFFWNHPPLFSQKLNGWLLKTSFSPPTPPSFPLFSIHLLQWRDLLVVLGQILDVQTVLWRSEIFLSVIPSSKPLCSLVFRYSLLKNRLYVTVKSFKDLVSPDPASKTNPLVRLYLLPDRSKRTRRVTKELSGTLNGVLNETFEYIVGLDQLRTMQIDVAVKSDRGFKLGRARNRLIGTAVVDLSQKALSDGCDVTCELRKFSLTFWPDTNRFLLDFKNSWT